MFLKMSERTSFEFDGMLVTLSGEGILIQGPQHLVDPYAPARLHPPTDRPKNTDLRHGGLHGPLPQNGQRGNADAG